MLRNRIVAAALLGLLAVASLRCSPGPDKPSGSGRFMSIGTAPVGGAFFVVGGAIAQVLTENRGDHPWEFTAEATAGTKENVRLLDDGKIDLALANSAITYFAQRGERGWDRPYALRTVMTLAPNIAMFVTVQGSGITTIQDLRGKRVVIGPAGAGFEYFVEPLLAAHGLTFDDFSPLNGTQADAVALLGDGSAAAAFLGGAVPTASITQASASQDIFLVPYDEAAMEQLIREYVFFDRATVPAETYRGQDTPYAGLDVGSMHLITTAAAAEQLIYDLTAIALVVVTAVVNWRRSVI